MNDEDLFDVEEDPPERLAIDGFPTELLAPVAAETPTGDADEDATTYYGSADEWVRKFLLPTYRRRVTAKGQSGGFRWNAAWWSSVEAMLRLESQWRMWEVARKNSGELSAWMINHLDVHMSILLSADGPFATSADENRPGEPLPYRAPSQGMFPPDCQP